jgi:DNA (cytosine-5)-methyltransferase 1
MLDNFLIQPKLYPKAREITQTIKPYTVVSLFSGCGGMDLGFLGGFASIGRAYNRHPFEIVWANELNKAACATYRSNIDDKIHCGDIWDYMNMLPPKADVLIGGFPCQDLSINGKGLGVKGKRSSLYVAMIEAIKRVKPKVFVAENVKGLLLKTRRDSFEKIMSDFNSLGYDVSHSLYQAADYAVPQTRERVFIVGTLRGVSKFLPPQPVLPAEEWISVSEAISDLELVGKEDMPNHIWSMANKSSEQGNRRLVSNRPGFTIRAECHGNIQFHYSLPRRISMREAARIQSFPDDFVFESKLRETERQIGNAVPPVLAWHIASSVLNCLNG